jgi:SsrA-binding protein
MPKYYKVIAENRKARHDFEVLEVYKAGVALRGSEVKSIRLGKVNLRDSFGKVQGGEIWLWNVHITPYSKTGTEQLDPTRARKLLLKNDELSKIIGKATQKGYTLIPLKIYFDGDWAKVDLALCKAKKLYEKKSAIKERDIIREADKELRERNK